MVQHAGIFSAFKQNDKQKILVSGPAKTLTVPRHRLLGVLVGDIHETFMQQQI